MTWPPDPQPACEPDCTCRRLPGSPYTPIPRRTPTCVCCAPPEVTARWIAQTDPAPVEEPAPVTVRDIEAFASSDLARDLQEATQAARASAASMFGIPVEQIIGDGPGLRVLSDPADPDRSARIRRIVNAARRTT